MNGKPGGIAKLQNPDGAIGVYQVTLAEGGEGDVVKVHRGSCWVVRV